MADASCIFCRIIAGAIPGDFVFRGPQVVAFRDIQPAAPVHVLVVPREHIASLAEVTPEQWPLVAETLKVAQQVAQELGLAASGYRVIANSGRDAGQAVAHLHWHLLGGRPLGALVG